MVGAERAWWLNSEWLVAVGQHRSGERQRGDIPHSRSGALAERTYHMSKVSSSGFAGAAMKRYPTSKV